MTNDKEQITDEEALAFHSDGQPGKVAITSTKPLMTQRDLSLGYSPGVAVPCLAIQKDPSKAYDYTSRGNFVAVISNGTAVLGLGNLGALASKPATEGKAILSKRFADIDAVGIACLELIKRMGIRDENAFLIDKTGVIYEGRTEGMNQWKSAHAVKTSKRTLADAMEGADMFMGLAAKNAVTPEMVKSMAK